MELEQESVLRLRKPSLKPIETKRTQEEEGGGAGGDDHDGEPLSPASRMFHEAGFNVHVIVILGSKTRIYPDVVKPNLVHTLLKHPRFSSLQVVDEKGEEMKWVRTNVNLDHHVIVPDIDTNNIDSPDKFVEDYISDLTKTPLDKSKPLWDLHLLNIKTSHANAIGVFRIHHSHGDGASLLSLFLACTRQISNPEALPTIPTKKKKEHNDASISTSSNHGFLGRYFFAFWSVLGAFWAILIMFWNTIVDVFLFMATTLFLKDTKTPIENQPGSELTPRRFVHRTVSLDDMKLVKNAMNATINDVAVGVTQAGLSRYLNRKYGDQNKKDEGATEKKNNLPKNIRLRSTLLINLRPRGIEALAEMMEKNTDAKWGNRIGYVLLPFTIALRDNPLDYVREAKATIDRKKTSFEAIFTYCIAEFVLKFFGIKWAGMLSHRVISHTTLCFSNLVGPLEDIGFYGHSMTYMAPSSYGQPQGLMINFQSHVNKTTIVLSVDETTVPDPHQLCDDLEESLNLIKNAVLASRSNTST